MRKLIYLLFVSLIVLPTGNLACSKTNAQGLEVTITSPADGATINGARVIVKGTFEAGTDNIGISVNGVVAEILDGGWVANGVPLAVGDNTIEAVISDSAGNTANNTITVHTDSTKQAVTLTANTVGGIPQLEVYFRVDTYMPGQVAKYQMDFEGDGTVDYTGADFEDVTHTYTAAGVCYPTITVTDSEGNTYTDTITVTVLSKENMDALLTSIWKDMKAALLAGDIEGALQYVVPGNRDMMREQLTTLGPELNSVISSIEGCEVYSLNEDIAYGGLLRTEDGNVYSYPITFMAYGNGVWMIKGF